MLLYEKIESIAIWNQWASLVSYGVIAFGLGILIYFWIRLLLSRNYKAKYDFRNLHEIKLLFYSSVFLISGIAMFLTTLSNEPTVVWFIVSLFVAIMMSILAISVIHNLLNFYYPTFLEKKLQHLRYKPRISPKSGKPMKLLSEEKRMYTLTKECKLRKISSPSITMFGLTKKPDIPKLKNTLDIYMLLNVQNVPIKP